MAQLRDTVVSGSLRATDSLLTTTLQTKILNAPAESNGTSYGPGSNGQVLISNGTSTYWGTTTGITQVGTITSGTWSATTIAVNKGGTGKTSWTQWGIVYASASTTLAQVTAGASGNNGYLLQSNGAAAPGWIQATNSNVGSTIVKRDSNGDFTSRLISGIRFLASRTDHSANTGMVVENTDSTDPLKLGYVIGTESSGGIYDYTHNAWKVEIAPDGTTNFYGNATSATQDASGNTITDKYFQIYNTSYQGNDSTVTVNDLATQGPAYGMIYSATDNPHGKATWTHVLNMGWSKANTSWIGQIAVGTGYGMWYRVNGNSAIAGTAWTRVIDSDNYTAYTVTKTGDGASGSWDISITGGLSPYAFIGNSTDNHGTALKNWFTDNKSTAPRNKIISFYSSTSGNGSLYMGYFLSGYENNPYGGFFVCHYDNPYYVGIANGTYTQQHILTSTNYTSYTSIYLQLSGGTMTGKLTLLANQYGGPSGAHGLNCNNSDICSVNGIFTADAAETTSEGLNFFRSASTWDSMTANGGTFYFMANHAFNANYSTTATANIRASKVYGAVWNDYAEYRECDLLSPGTCVQENDNGYLTISDKRLLAGASIISDTFGYAEGETEKAQTPIAVSGRVLAYTYLPREMYHAGMAVCSAPGGTVDIMTRDEIRDYPDAIIGIVSEIPDYETWGSGNIEVNGRIWIKVK